MQAPQKHQSSFLMAGKNEKIGFIDGITHFYKTTSEDLSWQLMTASFKSIGLFHFYNENEGFNIESVYAYGQGGIFQLSRAL
jgi:hypothetical protein